MLSRRTKDDLPAHRSIMKQLQNKVQLLKRIATAFHQAQLTWALGASMMLYFKGIITTFHDIDIMIMFEDVETVKSIMHALGGTLTPPKSDKKYQTKAFLEYLVDGIEVDIMAGFAIQKDGNLHDCSLLPDQIEEYMDVEGVKIPLQSLALWRKYYELMGRGEKVQLMKEAMRSD